MRDLVFVHGRDQARKNGQALKDEWMAAWAEGLKKSGLTVPLPANRIHFPYYGDTLEQLTAGAAPGDAAKIVVRKSAFGRGGGSAQGFAPGMTPEELAFIRAVALESLGRFERDPEAAIRRDLPANTSVERGILNWEGVQAVLQLLDRYLPGASDMSVWWATRDVFRYLSQRETRAVIDAGVASAISENAVVVAHSLGSVVAYNVLRQQAAPRRWNVPLFVTLGSPLAVTVVKRKLAEIAPLDFPAPVAAWFNAMDERDVVPLYPLDRDNFPLTPAITNKTDVHNGTPNAHGISGYLSDPDVAKTIHAAVTAV
ncbi:MAG: hypothetical protein LBV49_11730 [Azonexus sp.]|jgi:hypothetical protein|nr:hypothetical protein [Azonexus sp.]